MESILFTPLTPPKQAIKTTQTRCPTTKETILIRTTNNNFVSCCFDDKKSKLCQQCKLKPENYTIKQKKRTLEVYLK